VTATAGESGLTRGIADAEELAKLRIAELHASAEALACSRVVLLGYPDSGSTGTVHPGSFAAVPTSEVAERLGISAMTVQSHVKNVLAKLGVHSKVEAVRIAWRCGAVAVPVSVLRNGPR